MTIFKLSLFSLTVVLVGAVAGCSSTSTKSPDVSGSIRTSLDQAGFKDVSVSQDRDKGVVTLGGHVGADGDKSQAESVAKSFAVPEVVSNQIAVIPPGAESDAKKVNSDLDREGSRATSMRRLLRTNFTNKSNTRRKMALSH
jgi:osmotically-inducible protein OsmY